MLLYFLVCLICEKLYITSVFKVTGEVVFTRNVKQQKVMNLLKFWNGYKLF